MIPKVSVVIPCYNMEKYLRKCMDSVVNQTLRDIQIICINDGSTDNTLAILQEYAGKDDRIQIVDKENTGYGSSVNRGFDLAEGEYLGIVESDDFAEPHMFETLYRAAKAEDADVVKAGYYQYATHPEEKNVPTHSPVRIAGKKIFCPMTDLTEPLKMSGFFAIRPAVWSAIYRKTFIRENGIRFNETPGASYQDVGFCFKVWTKAKRVKLVDEFLLHYRVDNMQSSIHSSGKVYAICDEFREVERFLRENPRERQIVMPVMSHVKYSFYLWNYERLTPSLQEEFLERFHEEFKQHSAEGTLRREYFFWYDWNNLQKILLDPKRYHELQLKKNTGQQVEDFYDAYPSHRPVRNRFLYFLVENLVGGLKYIYSEGIGATIMLFAEKIKKRISK